MSADIHFRRAVESDLDSLIDLETAFYSAEAYPFDVDEARALLTRLLREPERGQIWVSERDHELVGYFILTFGYSIEFHGVNAVLDELYVQPDARGQGLGKRALELAEAVCKELGIRALHLVVERRNTPAHELYRRAGFTAHDRHIMTKHLPSVR